MGVGLTSVPMKQAAGQDPRESGQAIGAAIDSRSVGDMIGYNVRRTLEGVVVDVDGMKIGKLLFGSKPPTDSRSTFDGRLNRAYTTGGL